MLVPSRQMSEQVIVGIAIGAVFLGILLFVAGPIIFGRVLKRNHDERLSEQKKKDDDSA
jgi:hypothetical protein